MRTALTQIPERQNEVRQQLLLGLKRPVLHSRRMAVSLCHIVDTAPSTFSEGVIVGVSDSDGGPASSAPEGHIRIVSSAEACWS